MSVEHRRLHRLDQGLRHLSMVGLQVHTRRQGGAELFEPLCFAACLPGDAAQQLGKHIALLEHGDDPALSTFNHDGPLALGLDVLQQLVEGGLGLDLSVKPQGNRHGQSFPNPSGDG